jgi:hypothetical protein
LREWRTAKTAQRLELTVSKELVELANISRNPLMLAQALAKSSLLHLLRLLKPKCPSKRHGARMQQRSRICDDNDWIRSVEYFSEPTQRW